MLFNSSKSQFTPFKRIIENAGELFKLNNVPHRLSNKFIRAFSEADLDNIRNNFHLANKGEFNKLNIDEFNNFIAMTTGKSWEYPDLLQLFTMIDTNQDQHISLGEIQTHLCKSLCDQPWGNYVYAFWSFDKDFDDFIYLEELRNALFFLGFCRAGDPRITKFFHSRDTNRDGRINFDEFVKIVKEDMPKLLELNKA